MRQLKVTALLIGFFIIGVSFAKDLGVYGVVYPIGEEDIREFIYSRLQSMEHSGELEKAKTKFIENVNAHVLRPTPVLDLTTTNEPKVFYYDPTYVLKQNIADADGNILFAKGLKINPLEKVKLHSVLLFFNADDNRQIKWALAQAKKFSYVKFILIRGNIKEASDTINNKVYFDQYGKFTTRFGIKHIPCILIQNGSRLKIQEFALKEES